MASRAAAGRAAAGERGAEQRMKNKSIIPPLLTVSLRDYRAKEKNNALSTRRINEKLRAAH